VTSRSSVQVVVTDANILINFIQAGRLSLLGLLTSFEFVLPAEVASEVTDPVQRAQLEAALTRGELRTIILEDTAELTIYAALRPLMGKGEAACLALAEARHWLIASDEKKRFRLEVFARLGKDRLVTTAGLFVLAIQAGLLSVEEADRAKKVLEQYRFRMKFQSFSDLIEDK
jgi:predicted nucleic acid-binding protein